MGRGKDDSHFLMDVALPSAHKVISFPSAHKDKVISLPSAHVSQKVKATFFTLSNASLMYLGCGFFPVAPTVQIMIRIML